MSKVGKPVTYLTRKVAGNFMGFLLHFPFNYFKILLAKLTVLLFRSAWENSFVFCNGNIIASTFSSFFFPRVCEINWRFQDLSKKYQKKKSQYTLGETPTTYFQSLNGWFNTVSDEFPFSAHFFGSTTNNLLKERKYLQFEGWLDNY